MTEGSGDLLAAIAGFRLKLADEVQALQDSPSKEKFSSEIKLYKQLGARLGDIEGDLHSIRDRAQKRASELLTKALE
jgi:hypothetical protein